jgi:dTDP-4-dehydrorhamnose reductase
VAVTGSGGLLGRAVLDELEAHGHAWLGLPRGAADATDKAALLAALEPFRPDWVFHLAAFTRVDACESEPDRAFLVNGLAARNAALAAAALGASVLAVSTDYVFDGSASRPWREHDPARPLGVYGRSKWAGEQAVREVHPRHTVVRTSWLFGPGGANFVDTILVRARAGQPLAVVGDQRGSPTRTRDLAVGLRLLAERGEYGTFHCTNAGDCTWHELALHALARAGLAAPVERITTERLGRPAPRPAYSVLDGGWFAQVTGHRMPHWKDAVDAHLAETGTAQVPAERREPS